MKQLALIALLVALIAAAYGAAGVRTGTATPAPKPHPADAGSPATTMTRAECRDRFGGGSYDGHGELAACLAAATR